MHFAGTDTQFDHTRQIALKGEGAEYDIRNDREGK